MCIDDRSADRETHPQTIGFGGVKRGKQQCQRLGGEPLADEEFRGIREDIDAVPATASAKTLPTAGSPAVYQAADAAASPAASPAIKNQAGPVTGFLKEFPNAGWAAFVTVLFFVLAFLADWYFGTKITHLAMAAPTQLPPV